MNIIEIKHKWNGTLVSRKQTGYIILHHRAGNGSVESIHQQHLSQGWTGIGYHFYVRKDGSIYRGRPIETVGAHCQGWNDRSVGVCFEGNFEKEQMSVAQVEAGQALVAHLKDLYPHAKVTGHKDLNSTACPGKNFRLDEMQKEAAIMTVAEATEIVQTTAGLESKTIEFLLCYKYGEDLIVKLAQAIKRK